MKLSRTHYCGLIEKGLIGKEIVLCGWVDRWRDHGGVVFIDLRDREGVGQIVFDPGEISMEEAWKLRTETVIGIKGNVRARPSGMENSKLRSGSVEVVVKELEVLSRAAQLPFSLHDDSPSSGEVDESLRLQYRYLELRKPKLQENLRIRHAFLTSARDFYNANGFWEIETPILYKSTPEGARDYLVPSRVHPGMFFALPQSPQTLKQLCMIAGLDRYVQIARCFRDEDLRADRQPEFTQVDVEMSFVKEEDIIDLHEKLMQKVMKDVLGENVAPPFTRLRYQDAMSRFGSDKPDLRNRLELVDLTDEGKESEFQVFRSVIDAGGIVKGLWFWEKEPLSRSELDGLPKQVGSFGAKGVSWIRIKAPGDWQAPQAKFFPAELKKKVEDKLGCFKSPQGQSVLLLMVCAKEKVVHGAMGFLRDIYGKKQGFMDKDKFRFAWITDFPLFEYNDEDKRLYAAHHPFTRPNEADLNTFLTSNDAAELQKVRAHAYDLVLNGYEIGGGSLRIYREDVQQRMFQVLGLTQDEANSKFGFFLKALTFGTPPHGGIALGVDRVAMLLSGTDAIRDVIAFPKTQKATCLMSEAPSPVSEAQLTELHIKVLEKKPSTVGKD